MHGLTEEGRRIVAETAARHGLSEDAVTTLLAALDRGGGTQAQFDHPELGGMGQWSMGGMVMVGDMFNNALKAQVDSVCRDLSAALAAARLFAAAPRPTMGSHQSQSQGSGMGGVSFGVLGSEARGAWWPEALGNPSSTGTQNDMSYAVFPSRQRLALNTGGRVRVFDTGPHQIGGFSQQQGGGQSLTFTSQFGLVRLDDLTEVTERETGAAVPEPEASTQSDPGPGTVADAPPPPEDDPVHTTAPWPPAAHPAPEDDIIAKIERLAGLRDRGILSEDEFQAKKAELLARL